MYLNPAHRPRTPYQVLIFQLYPVFFDREQSGSERDLNLYVSILIVYKKFKVDIKLNDRIRTKYRILGDSDRWSSVNLLKTVCCSRIFILDRLSEECTFLSGGYTQFVHDHLKASLSYFHVRMFGLNSLLRSATANAKQFNIEDKKKTIALPQTTNKTQQQNYHVMFDVEHAQ